MKPPPHTTHHPPLNVQKVMAETAQLVDELTQLIPKIDTFIVHHSYNIKRLTTLRAEIGNAIPQAKQTTPWVDIILAEVARYYGLSVHEIVNDKKLRTHPLVQCREMVCGVIETMGLMYHRDTAPYGPIKLKELATRLNRDRTTLLHAIYNFQKYKELEPAYAADFKHITARVDAAIAALPPTPATPQDSAI